MYLFLILAFGILVHRSKGQNPMVQTLLADVRLDSLTGFIKQLTGEKPVVISGLVDTIKSRHSQHPGNEKAFRFMKTEFSRFGYQLDTMQFSANGKNLFAIKPGFKYPNRRFMLGAHYDNLPFSGIAKGADDNASGTAAVLEAARVFKNYNFPYTIVFALWDEEEQGLLGSIAYAQTIGADNDTLLGYVNLDMLGWDGNNDSIADINTKNIANSVAFANKAQYCNSAYNLQLGIHILNPGEESSDQAAFWNTNHTAIGIGEEHHTDFYPYWHTQADLMVHLNLNYYRKCAKLAYATIADFALDTLNVVGIGELNGNELFKIYPNPFSSLISIQTGGNRIEKVKILDCMGNTVYNATSLYTSIDIILPELTEGIYTLLISIEKSFFVRKIIKR